MDHGPGFLKLCEDALARVREVSIDAVAGRLGDAGLVLVDVREDHEWVKGHVMGAIHLGRGILERDVEARFPDKGQELILYCGGGFRSALSADNLQKMGYTNVWSMAGGWRGWTGNGLPTSTS